MRSQANAKMLSKWSKLVRLVFSTEITSVIINLADWKSICMPCNCLLTGRVRDKISHGENSDTTSSQLHGAALRLFALLKESLSSLRDIILSALIIVRNSVQNFNKESCSSIQRVLQRPCNCLPANCFMTKLRFAKALKNDITYFTVPCNCITNTLRCRCSC